MYPFIHVRVKSHSSINSHIVTLSSFWMYETWISNLVIHARNVNGLFQHLDIISVQCHMCQPVIHIPGGSDTPTLYIHSFISQVKPWSHPDDTCRPLVHPIPALQAFNSSRLCRLRTEVLDGGLWLCYGGWELMRHRPTATRRGHTADHRAALPASLVDH